MKQYRSRNGVIFKSLKFLTGNEKYLVGDNGTIWGKKTGKWKRLKTYLTSKGNYQQLSIYGEGWRASFPVHKLVLLAFVGPKPEGMEACHLDDNKMNNRLSNLRWDTHKSNMRDRRLNGGNKKLCKLTEDDVREIHRLFATGKYSTLEIDRMFGVVYQTFAIVRGRTWTYVDCPEREANLKRGKRMDADTVREIRKLRSEGMKTVQLSEQFGISDVMVRNIVSRRSWPDVD